MPPIDDSQCINQTGVIGVLDNGERRRGYRKEEEGERGGGEEGDVSDLYTSSRDCLCYSSHVGVYAIQGRLEWFSNQRFENQSRVVEYSSCNLSIPTSAVNGRRYLFLSLLFRPTIRSQSTNCLLMVITDRERKRGPIGRDK